MSHFTCTVVIRNAANSEEALSDLASMLDPFDENKDTEPYPQWLNAEEVERCSAFYRAHPEFCPGESDGGPVKPFDVYVTEGNLEAWNEWTRQAVGAYDGNDRNSGIYDPDEDRFGCLSTYNPDSRWDWWELGGRWHGFYQLKPKVDLAAVPVPEWRKSLEERHPVKGDRIHGEEQLPTYDGSQDAVLGNGGTFGDDEGENFSGRADLARKGDIDFEGMRIRAGLAAEEAYDAYEKVTEGLALPETWQDCCRRIYFDHDLDPDETYDGYVMVCTAEYLEPMSPEEWNDKRRRIVDEARRQYHAQPWIMALQEANLLGFFGDPIEDWCVHTGGRETYIQRARDNVVGTHAVLIDDRWHEAGKMGWFATVSNEKDHDTWVREQARLLESLPDDVYLAVVDCHI